MISLSIQWLFYPPSIEIEGMQMLNWATDTNGHETDLFQYIKGFIGFLGGSVVKNMSAKKKTLVWSLGQEDPLEQGMATHSSILAWRIPWTRGAWRAAVHGVAKSRTWLKWFSMHAITKMCDVHLDYFNKYVPGGKNSSSHRFRTRKTTFRET